MDLFMRWVRARPRGNTGLKGTLTTIPELPELDIICEDLIDLLG